MKTILLMSLFILSISCDQQEIESSIKEASQDQQKQQVGASPECLDKYETMILNLLDLGIDMGFTSNDCCLDPAIAKKIENKLIWYRGR